MKNKIILIPILLLLAVGLLFLVRAQFTSDEPVKNNREEKPPKTDKIDPRPEPPPDTDINSSLPRYLAPPGRVLLYDFRMVSDMELVLDLQIQPGQPPARATVKTVLTGKLECTGYQSPRSDQLLLGYQFKTVHYELKNELFSIDPQMLEEYREQLRKEFLVYMTPRGEIKDFFHQPSMEYQMQSLQKTPLLNCLIILPEKQVDEWEENEADQTGTFLALYQKTSGEDTPGEISISKEKAFYESVSELSISGNSNNKNKDDKMMAFPKGITSATFLVREGRLQRVNQKETLELLGSGLSSGTKAITQTDLKFLSQTHDAKLAALSKMEMSNRLERMEASGLHGGKAMNTYLEQKRISRFEPLADGHTVEETLATLRHLIETGNAQGRENYEAIMVLAALLALDDARVAKIQALIQSEKNMDLLRRLINALGGAGTPAAQKVLMETLTDTNLNPLLRDSAMFTFYAPMTPSIASEEAMKSLVNPKQKDELELGLSSLIVLGVMANRLGSTNSERSANIVHHILDQEEAFRDANQSICFLNALENAGHPDAYKSILPYMDASNPDDIRDAAVAALGKMPQEEATSHLVVAMSDKSSTVRITAIQASGNRPASSSLTEKMKDLVLKDSVTQVRAEALGYFADKVGSDQALRPILQKVANSDPDPQIREAALNALNQ